MWCSDGQNQLIIDHIIENFTNLDMRNIVISDGTIEIFNNRKIKITVFLPRALAEAIAAVKGHSAGGEGGGVLSDSCQV